MYDSDVTRRIFQLAKEVYSDNISAYNRSRRLFDYCLENNWPVEVAAGCLLYFAYEANPIDYQGVIDSILEVLPSAKSVLETLSQQNKSFEIWMKGVKMSPYGKAVVWLRALDELAAMSENSDKWLEYLSDLRPDFTL